MSSGSPQAHARYDSGDLQLAYSGVAERHAATAEINRSVGGGVEDGFGGVQARVSTYRGSLAAVVVTLTASS